MSKRIVVYGLGKLYQKYKQHIEACDKVVAHCDKNTELVKEYSDGITAFELSQNIDYYDEVMVTAKMVRVLPYLKKELHIPKNKIKYFETEIMSYGGGPKLRFFASSGEDAVLCNIFRERGILLKDVKYLEIGTNDPIAGNNSFFLYQAGARGVLVDPMPIVSEAVALYRPEDRMMQLAVTGNTEKDSATFYISNTLGSSSLHEDFQTEFIGENRTVVDSFIVPLLGVNALLERIGFMPDFMQVDAEGEDEAIVRAIDFTKYRPKVLMVEIDHCSEKQMVNFMMEKKYTWYTTVGGVNAIFVDEG